MTAQTGRGKKRVAVTTLGCKVNQYESAAYLSALAEREEVEVVPFGEPADVYVINTCAVTARAGAQSRQLIRRAARHRRARLVVTGCYAQVAPQEVLELTENPLCIVGNAHKGRVAEIAVAGRGCDLEMYYSDMAGCRGTAPLLVTTPGRRTRAVLKVQDGCSQGCSYCIVPRARGGSRSVPLEQIIRQLEFFVAAGYREVVLTGIHLGHYGLELTPTRSLAWLVEELLTRNFPIRYRLSSLEPTEVSPELLNLLATNPRLQPHLHIPLQSGDDNILAAMNRPYRRDRFAEVVAQCRAALPEAAIGVDVLVGFPGEDEAAFNHTFELLSQLPVAYFHVFPYSKRPGTPAATMAGQVAERVKEQRAARLRELDRQKREDFQRRFLGRCRRVLAEGSSKKDKGAARRGELRGFTDNYIPVSFAAGAELVNREVEVLLEEIAGEVVRSRLVDPAADAVVVDHQGKP